MEEQEQEKETRWERIQRNLPVVVVMTALICLVFTGWLVYNRAHNKPAIAPAASQVTTPTDCTGWITRADMALALTPETLTSDGITFGALLVCHHTTAKAVTLRVIAKTERADIPMDVDPAPAEFATLAQLVMPPLPIGYYEVQFLVDGRVVAHTWLEIQPETK